MSEARIFKKLKSGELRRKNSEAPSSWTNDEDELDATATIEDEESRRRREEQEDTTPSIDLKLKYDFKENQFLLTLDRCRNLALPEEEEKAEAENEKPEESEEGIVNSGATVAVDLNPRVKFRLLPSMSKEMKRTSTVKKSTSSPVWHKDFKWSIAKPMLELFNLWVTVWDVRMFKSPRLLGEVLIPLGYQPLNDTSPHRFTLSLPFRKAEVPPSITPYRGELILAIKFEPSTGAAEAAEAAGGSPQPASRTHRENSMVDRKTSVFQRTGDVSATQEGHLHVQVRQGRRLLSADGNPCNAYCQVTLRPLRGVKGERTPSIPNTNDPNWNHTVHFKNVTIEQLQRQCLQVSVYNKGRLGNLFRRTLLGGVRLNLGPVQYSQEFRVEFLEGEKPLLLPHWMDARGDEVLAWLAALQRPNTWIVATLLLRPMLTAVDGTTEGLLLAAAGTALSATPGAT